MICDQCGFEHNSRGTCPKCGARVVYVNEDYEKRRQAYLEAQKKAAAGDKSETEGIRKTSSGVVVPPGVHYSTEDEHNMKTGRDRAPSRYQADDDDGAQKDFGTVFAGAVEHILLAIAQFIVWCRKRIQMAKKKAKKKRGVNNPVVSKLTFEDERNLEFDDGKETLDTSKLVLDHKVFMDKRVPITIGILGGAVVLIGLIVFLIVWNHLDHTMVLAYGQTDTGAGIYQLNDVNKSNWKVELADGDHMDLIAYANDGKTVVYVMNHRLVVNRGADSVSIRLDEEAEYTTLMLSENGKYYTVVGCINEEHTQSNSELSEGDAAEGQGSEATNADETYVMYAGKTDGEPTEIYRGSLSCDPIAVTQDGYVVYRKMETAAYGMIGSKSMEAYQVDTSRKLSLADTYSDYQFVAKQNYLYYITNQKLYRADIHNPSKFFLDDGVTGFAQDALQAYDGVLYEKSAGVYCADGSGEEGKLVLSTKLTGLTIYQYGNSSVLAVLSQSGGTGQLYAVKKGTDKAPKLVKDEDAEGTYEVQQVLRVENEQALLYTTAQGTYVMRFEKNGVRSLDLHLDSLHFEDAIRSNGTYRLLTKANQLYEISEQGEELSESAQIYDIWCVK